LLKIELSLICTPNFRMMVKWDMHMYERPVLLISRLQGTGVRCVERDIQIEISTTLSGGQLRILKRVEHQK
jgi:hypothetical protein